MESNQFHGAAHPAHNWRIIDVCRLSPGGFVYGQQPSDKGHCRPVCCVVFMDDRGLLVCINLPPFCRSEQRTVGAVWRVRAQAPALPVG